MEAGPIVRTKREREDGEKDKERLRECVSNNG